jgi:hypothetical protein
MHPCRKINGFRSGEHEDNTVRLPQLILCPENGYSTVYPIVMKSGQGEGTIMQKPHALVNIKGYILQ